MGVKWIERLTGSLEQKKQYRQAVARMDALPEPYRTTAKAYQRYFMYYGGVLDGDDLVTMWCEFADLWERAVADGTSVPALVGDDPVAFGEEFVQAYASRRWIDKERARLTAAVAQAITEAES